MTTYIARSVTNKLVAIPEGEFQEGDLLQFLNDSATWTIYRIAPVGDGTFLLTPQRIAPGTEVTTSVITGATLEDDV